jgi:hypothetical protein
MRCMTLPDLIVGRDLRLVTWTGAIATALFAVVTGLTTQVKSIRSTLPFTEDPYDAVVSFAAVGIAIVAGATIVRALGQARRPYDPAVARRIAIGAAIATVAGTTAVVSDIVALVLGPTDVSQPGVGLALGLLALTAASLVVALACIGRAHAAFRDVSAPPEAEPDMLDALDSIIEAIGAAAAARALASWLDRSPLSPRRHRILVGLLAAVAAGLAAVAWHAFREGPWASNGAAAFFGLLMAAGVAVAYLVCLAPLRLLRPAARE